MINDIKTILKKTPLFREIDQFIWEKKCKTTIRNRDIIIKEWENIGKPVPPPASKKQAVILGYKDQFDLRTLVETGTFRGDMLYAMKNEFSKIYSIELFDSLFNRSERIFSKDTHIKLLNGNSAEMLEIILKEVTEPSLFWLDAHYSGEGTAKADANTPVIEEIKLILKYSIKNHVVLIDDAREFINKTTDYPTLDEIEGLVKNSYKNYTFDIEDDIIRICLL